MLAFLLILASIFYVHECPPPPPPPENQGPYPTKALAILSGSNGVSGRITFQQTEPFKSITITGTISGLSEGLHGFHVHQYGNLTNGCTSAGSHFNPKSFNHSAPTDKNRHAGDLGNIKADKDGVAVVDITDSVLALGGLNSVLGRAVVVHAGQDDLGQGGNDESLKTGNAGSRLACGVVGLAEEVAP